MPKYEQLHRDAHEYVRRYERRQRLITFAHFAADMFILVLGMTVIVLALSIYLR